MVELLQNINAAWIVVREQPINAKAYPDKLFYQDRVLSLTFPADSIKAEELNCIALGIDYEIIRDRVLDSTLTVKPQKTSCNKLYNFTELDYRIDLSHKLLAFTGDQRIAIVERIDNKNQIVIDTADNTVQCSSNLINKEITIAGKMIYPRWIQELYEEVNSPLEKTKRKKKYKPLVDITAYLLNNEEIQGIAGKIVAPQLRENTIGSLLSLPTRTVKIKDLTEIHRERIDG